MEVERLDLAAEEGGVARRLGEKPQSRSKDDEDESEPPKFGRKQPPAETVDRQHDREHTQNPGQVVGGDQGEMQQPGEVAEQQVEAKKEDASMRLAGIGIGPQPRPIRALADLGQVGGGAVGDEEGAGEMKTAGGP